MARTSQTVSPAGLQAALDAILTRFDVKTIKGADAVLRETAKNMFGQIIEDTPVGDFDPDHAGTLKGAWIVRTGSPATGTSGRMKPGRTREDLKIPRLVTKQGTKRLYMSNNEDYINVVEYGGYTKAPKLGTWDKRKKAFVIRSKGGFSRQAPKGMVRQAMAQHKKFLDIAANKVFGK